MRYFDKNENQLLKRSFLVGLIGIILCLVPLYQNYSPFAATNIINIVLGIGLAAQVFALSMAVLVLRKAKIPTETKEKAQKMVLILTVSLLFFILAA
jgi:ABC-type glycerol-3-phosphate transport system permease component